MYYDALASVVGEIQSPAHSLPCGQKRRLANNGHNDTRHRPSWLPMAQHAPSTLTARPSAVTPLVPQPNLHCLWCHHLTCSTSSATTYPGSSPNLCYPSDMSMTPPGRVIIMSVSQDGQPCYAGQAIYNLNHKMCVDYSASQPLSLLDRHITLS